MFIEPKRLELKVIAEVLDLFGSASGLQVNLSKSSIIPIRRNLEINQVFLEDLPCPLVLFPCTNLGLPLAPGILKKEDLLKLVDCIADLLPP